MRVRCAHQAVLGILLVCQFSVCLGKATPDANDTNRYLNAVRTFADNVLKYGRDTYGPKHTPLFVDGLNIRTHEPVKWIDPDGTRWILSNFASQQTLLRTLDGLSEITGDPQYRQAAMDAIHYAFENMRTPNGLFYWGEVAAYDAQSDKIFTRAKQRGHTEIVELLSKAVKEQAVVHGVAVANISVPSSCVQGDIVSITATLKDRGDASESCEITLTDVTDGNEIGNQGVAFPRKFYNAADSDLTFTGENPGDYFSVAVVSQGDLNGDGFDDLLLTAPRYGSATKKHGRAYLYYGKSDLSSLSVDLTLDSEDTNAQFGQDGFFGDVNGDGLDDMVIGDWGYNNKQGRVYLYFGNQRGIAPQPNKIFEAESGLSDSEFGFRNVLGDVDNDGYADLAVYADNYGGNAAGRVYLYYGAPGTSMDTTCDLVFDGAGGDLDNFGRSVIISKDINDDGYGDVVIGSQGWGEGQGRAYIFLGDKREKMDAIPDLILIGENKGDRFTRYFDVGDINGDKIADMAIGASYWGEPKGRGRVYIYYGDPNLDNLATCDATIDEPLARAFGVGVLIGDVNADGIVDLMVGASEYPQGQNWGRVWLYYGGDHSFDTDCDVILSGEAQKTNFGRYMDVGDLNNDGHTEIIIGAWSYPDFTFQGRMYIFRGEDRSSSREVTFNWLIAQPTIGKHTLKVEIPPVPGEQNTKDNIKTVTIEVKEPRR